MPILLVAFILAFLITKTIQDAKTDRALADKGIVSPRLHAKYGDRAAEKASRYGLLDYARDAWSDNWQQRTELRRAAADAARDAAPSAGRGRVTWRDRLSAARRAVVAAAEKAAPVVRKLVDPVPPRRDRNVPAAPPVAPSVTVGDPGSAPDVDGERRCPDCGRPLTRTDAGWDHPDGAVCPETGRRYRPSPRPSHRPVTRRRPPVVGPDTCVGCNRPIDPAVGVCLHCMPTETRRGLADLLDPDQTPTEPEGVKPMSAPTGEAVNHETTIAELEAIAAEQRKQIDAAKACLTSVEDAKNHIDGMQDAARTAAEASAGVNDHLAALNLDAETLGHVGTAADALPASTVDTLLAQLEEVQASSESYLSAAETALGATEAALATVTEKYGDAHATVASELGGDPSYLGSGAPAGVSA